MNKRCSYCGFAVTDQVRCPICDTRLVSVNLRRALLWVFVAEEYLLVTAVLLRFS